MKNACLKKLICLARPWIPLHASTNRFLIVATTALGDTLWATAAIESIKKERPDCHLAVLTSPIGMEILRYNPYVNQLFIMKEPLSKYFFSLRKKLFQERFDTVLLFHASQRLALPLCSLIGAKKIIGTCGINKGLDDLLTHPLPNHFQHEITRRLALIQAVGIVPSVETLSIHLLPHETLPPRGKGPWIALHPGSKDAFKRWPKEHFIELGRRLKKTRDCEILITGSTQELALTKAVAAAIPGAHLDPPDRPLREFAALLSQMDLLISNDTGPVHLACALNRPVIALYASTDPALCGPHKAKLAHVIARRATCDPCLKRKCRLPFCLMQIGPEEVLQAVNLFVPGEGTKSEC
ncbi:MAG: hypothetical protein A3D96_07000 [Chlamydiae bacterium RIFCSPHIGHO2_12_FULL_44_59]|nr:MAG: hypothetical protein A2796_05925 [Chlamydiae bacterium RIFCSPHIGHO2_01_FULL_44_39]OGN57450.1 MAG: hypothetical protein A3C42_04310 [Chlamydiae bacterium RIFCSPHIGHO2_02_FULL_45_9]OGN60384.1 MAG: hypothetical protein A3D96_07000 [Chlamydiae bacterium RIFCSPHIGHO2_12_FULL_44_59]OGN66369.1 MAG: hypothetical protein A2978_07060 [Chlamydiae bacterium RIFCSPLOWO2_01_FULL_44_52]OGN69402.1 MAG: hypothetical protein A3I67_06580 [Chlamydiae bacterium RIFCSPLOWO2_02_FULL_45_22]OGN70555.1 MAG: hyp